MATISYDGQSFLIDGRRIWLVSGTIHYARIPHQLWRRRIRAAKQAGLNCIDTYVFWNIHEPHREKFHFEGDADLRRFIQIIDEEGMYCILRPGPYVGSGWDFGGLPAWLHRVDEIRFREANGPFLEACSRYLAAVMNQVWDLQVAKPVTGRAAAEALGEGGPIIMMQAENQWFCHNPDQGERYLREVVRYLRESGCAVPINVANNLWQRVEGAIDTWNAGLHVAADLRQLRLVQPEAPRLVTEPWPDLVDHWGDERQTQHSESSVFYHLASTLSVGAQFNISRFHAGTNFGFFGGRSHTNPAHFATTSCGHDAPLLEAGGRGPNYDAVKRICMFASQFGQLFANLEPEPHHAVVALNEDDHPLSIIQQNGSQGQIIFLLSGVEQPNTPVRVMLPDGQVLPVPIDKGGIAWFVLNANLGGVAELTYTNLQPWAFLDRKLLVLFGPAGAEGLVSINGTPLGIKVPSGRKPKITEHEDLKLVVLNPDQVDVTYILPTGLVVGADGLDEHDQPIPHPRWGRATRISINGRSETVAMKAPRTPAVPRLDTWQYLPCKDLIDGTSEAFEPIDGPASLEQLECDHGYGLYRISLKSETGGGSLLTPRSGDRLHVYTNGKRTALLGLGPGARYGPAKLTLGKENVVLADNLGRFSSGWSLGEPKGLVEHFYEADPVALGRPKMIAGTSPDPFEIRGFYGDVRAGVQVPAESLRWEFKPSTRKPMILDIAGLPQRTMLIINDVPIAMYDPVQSGGIGRFLLEPGQEITGGKNVLVLAFFETLGNKAAINKIVKLYQTNGPLTAKAEWSFALLPDPEPDSFEPIPSEVDDQPCWYRSAFRVSHTDVPLWFEPQDLSKGQIYINGHNAGRYFVHTHTGQAVGPQKRYYIPEPWLRTDQNNELIVFDEHGRSPRNARLVYDPMGTGS